MVSSHELLPFVSPYSGKLLKPYIWRDSETTSPWSQLMNEIKSKKSELNETNIEDASLDYCYVRPQHIASINSLCERYFWPGIDCEFEKTLGSYIIRLYGFIRTLCNKSSRYTRFEVCSKLGFLFQKYIEVC